MQQVMRTPTYTGIVVVHFIALVCRVVGWPLLVLRASEARSTFKFTIRSDQIRSDTTILESMHKRFQNEAHLLEQLNPGAAVTMHQVSIAYKCGCLTHQLLDPLVVGQPAGAAHVRPHARILRLQDGSHLHASVGTNALCEFVLHGTP